MTHDDLRDDIGLASLDDEALCGRAPEHVVVAERLHQLERPVHAQRKRRIRLRVLPHEPVDAAAIAFAQRRVVRIADAVLKRVFLRDRADRRRVVLDDEVVEVEEPQRAVGSDFRVHRRKPLVVAGGDVPAILLRKAGALTLDDRPMDDVAGGLVHEGDAVPVFLGERARRVEVVPRRGGEPALHVHLPDFLGVRLHRVVAVDLLLAVAGQAGDALVVRPRDRDVDAVLAVRGRAEHVEGSLKARPHVLFVKFAMCSIRVPSREKRYRA